MQAKYRRSALIIMTAKTEHTKEPLISQIIFFEQGALTHANTKRKSVMAIQKRVPREVASSLVCTLDSTAYDEIQFPKAH